MPITGSTKAVYDSIRAILNNKYKVLDEHSSYHKFGTLDSRKAQLNKRYGKPKIMKDDPSTVVYSYGKTENDPDMLKEGGGSSYAMYTIYNMDGLDYHTPRGNNKFTSFTINKYSDVFTVNDTNNNGKIDKDDTISFNYTNVIDKEMKLGNFLNGQNPRLRK